MPADTGSVAPKERVNITYKAAVGDQQVEKELPLKTLVLGDFSSKPDDTPVEERKTISVDQNNFNDVLASMDINLKLHVDNKLEEGGEEETSLPVDLKFQNIKDFGPEAVADQVPELKALMQLREALIALRPHEHRLPQAHPSLVDDESKAQAIMGELGGGGE